MTVTTTFETMGRFDTWPVEFGRDGNVLDTAQVDALIAAAAAPATDLLVLAHGWDNDIDEATALYRELLANLSVLPQAGAADRRFVVMRVYWPSKRFADEDLTTGGAASASDAAQQAVHLQIDALLADYRKQPPSADEAFKPQALRQMQALLPRLEDDVDAQADFARLARLLLPKSVNDEEPVLGTEFHSAEGSDLLQKLSRPFRRSVPAEEGGAAALGGAGGGGLDQGGAASFLGNALRGACNGARNLLNLFTYYEMKERAGVVGSTGVADVLRRVARPGLRQHLCGHSFGGRLVTAAVAARPADAEPGNGVRSLTLLQAAFSHNGFGVRFDGQQNGHFRGVFEGHRLQGPVVITHTRLDRVVGLAYPLASRLRSQVASGLGDENDPYGAIGRNGALFATDEVDTSETTLRAAGQPYRPFTAGRVYNLEGAGLIRNHSDVRSPQVAWALRHALDASL